jgi:hypothetical protein
MLSIQRKLIEDLSDSSIFANKRKFDYSIFLLDYIENNMHQNMYTIPMLREATKCTDDEALFEIVQYFSGGNSRLFNIKYCYYQDRDILDIDPIEFSSYYQEDIEPVDLNGNEIEDFNPAYLSFYCLINYE